jgi:GTP-binding protein Era
VAFRSGFVAVVGRPGVGKSSLINAVVGTKVSIVSDKPQTTRFLVRGVATTPEDQIVFVDTPGLHRPRTALGERLNRRVHEGTDGVDALLLVVDGAGGVGSGDAFVAGREASPFTRTRVLAVNKIDLLGRPKIAEQLTRAAALGEFDHIVPVSARSGAGLEDLRAVLAAALPEGGPLFPVGETTDQPIEIRVVEIIREKALALTREEVPHSIAVRLEEMERDDDRDLTRISCSVLVERTSQKGIVIGKGGAMLKEIGSAARRDLEKLLGGKVFLDLRVKVLREWQRDPGALDRLGL